MTPIDDVLCLPADKVLDHATIDAILLSGFSRIPIYEPNQRLNFVGMLLVKRVSEWRSVGDVRPFFANLLGPVAVDLVQPRRLQKGFRVFLAFPAGSFAGYQL